MVRSADSSGPWTSRYRFQASMQTPCIESGGWPSIQSWQRVERAVACARARETRVAIGRLSVSAPCSGPSLRYEIASPPDASLALRFDAAIAVPPASAVLMPARVRSRGEKREERDRHEIPEGGLGPVHTGAGREPGRVDEEDDGGDQDL